MNRGLFLLGVLAGIVVAGAAAHAAPGGQIEINLTDVIGHDLPGRVELAGKSIEKPVVIEVPKGHLKADAPTGAFKAYVYVYWQGVPVLVDAKDITVTSGNPAYVLLNLVEGTGALPLLAFDKDHDFAIDRVEKAAGTGIEDAASIPNRKTLTWEDKVLAKKEAWYRGELHAHSQYGGGKESVGQLIQRAEKAGLDFLAITDRNTLRACFDPEFKSLSLALIPAMEWGTDEKGVALIYGPRTFPELVKDMPQAQALVDLVQAQKGFYAIAHPCFPTAPWQWGLGYVNGIEVWCREWSGVPPLSVSQLSEDMKERKKGKYVHSIAFAAASAELPLSDEVNETMRMIVAGATGKAVDKNAKIADRPLSANDQANVFYDSELVRGLKAAAIAGSNTSSPEVPIGRPVTYVYAMEKSTAGILNGLRRGRTYVSTGVDGPKLSFEADVLDDGKMDVGIGGIIPLDVLTRFYVTVEGAKGKEVQILCNGYPLVSKKIEEDTFGVRIADTPRVYSAYRVRVISRTEKEDGFGPVEVLALSSPIYAEPIGKNVLEYLKTDKQVEQFKKKNPDVRVRDKRIRDLPNPDDNGVREITPKWRF